MTDKINELLDKLISVLEKSINFGAADPMNEYASQLKNLKVKKDPNLYYVVYTVGDPTDVHVVSGDAYDSKIDRVIRKYGSISDHSVARRYADDEKYERLKNKDKSGAYGKGPMRR